MFTIEGSKVPIFTDVPEIAEQSVPGLAVSSITVVLPIQNCRISATLAATCSDWTTAAATVPLSIAPVQLELEKVVSRT
jgi:hypothetical protein